jgi:hypothetical protein
VLSSAVTYQDLVAQSSGMISDEGTRIMAPSCPSIRNRFHGTLFQRHPYLFMGRVENKKGPLFTKVVEMVNMKSMYMKVLGK